MYTKNKNQLTRKTKGPHTHTPLKAVTSHKHKVHLAIRMLNKKERAMRGMPVFSSEAWGARRGHREK